MHAAVDTLIFSEERVEFREKDNEYPRARVLGSGHKEAILKSKADEGNDTAQVLYGLLRRCRVFHFHDTSETAKVRLSSYIEANRYLYPDGRWLLGRRSPSESECESYARSADTSMLGSPNLRVS
jgi:hypothetical protein